MRTTLITLATLSSFSPTLLHAGAIQKQEVVTVETATPKSAISGDLGVVFASQYFSRGLVFENQGLIAQPYFDLFLTLHEGDGFINKVNLQLGLWSSIHSKHTDAAPRSTTAAWYEVNFTPGIAVTFAKYWTLTTSYLLYASPNGGFQTFQGINFRLDLDDSELLGAFALRPHLVFMRELDNKAGDGSRKGNYYEAGIAPGFSICKAVDISFPITVGFGSHGFYAKNVGFGYFSGGIGVTVPLTFIPERYGNWSVTGNAVYYYLHGPLSTFNTPVNRASNHNEFLFSGGIGVVF